MVLGSEAGAVQNPLIRYAEEAGWEHLPRQEVLRLRGGETGLVLHDVLIHQLQRLNLNIVDLLRAEDVAKRLQRVTPTIEGNLDVWEFLKGLKAVFIEEERRERNVRFLDLDNVRANTFHVTDEYRYYNGTHRIRADVVFFINGVPVILVETKAATKMEGIAEALDQVRRYHREGLELLALLQLFNLTNLPHFFYGATWNLSRKSLYNWRDEQAGDFETLVKTFVQPRRVLRVLTDFILFTRKDEELQKVVLRPHQMRAVERIQRRAKDPEKHRGLIWHTQGSGKTYTMITVAKKLIEDPSLKNPTILMLVDRNELEAQLFQNLGAVGFGHVEMARSKRHLIKLLESDQRGLIVSMIHKFDDIPPRISLRENIFILVDEAHRTTGGELGNYLMGALPNATYIGFTGTPIDQTAHGKGTFKTFGSEDEQGYLDKYSIRESIEDGTTVPLHYALAPNELLVDREILEREFLRLAILEGVSDIEVLNRVLERAVTLKNMLKNPERISKVAEYVAEHKSTIEPMGYKAFLVAPDREGCTLYKRELDKHLPPEYSKVVISAAHNDPPELAEFHLREDEEKSIRQSFRKPDELPKILIVTEKLLTGFDAPILYCLYLDKPMRDHVLLQAIARVNRPYEDGEGRRKTAGFILDFVGIFEKLEDALAFDSDEVQGVVEGIEVLQKRFEDLIEEGKENYLPIWVGLKGDKATEAVLEHFREEERRERFYKYFKELEDLYEILSPSPLLSPYLKDYDRLTQIYQVLRAAYDGPNVSVDKSLLRKTAYLVQEHTHTREISQPGFEYTLTPEALLNLTKETKPETVKVFNLLVAIRRMVQEMVTQTPYLLSIGERAEAVAEAFEQHLSSTQEALVELTKIAEEIRDAEDRRKQSDLSKEAFSALIFLEGNEVKGAEKIARDSSVVFENNPHWRESTDQERHIRLAFFKALKDSIETKKMIELVDGLLMMLRRAPG